MTRAEYPQLSDTPMLVVLSGPSGSGKSTIIERFLARHPDFVCSISATTRLPRAGEQDGVHYHFLDEDEFLQRVADDAFLEHAQVFGRHYYGTPRSEVDRQQDAGRSVIMDLDVQGARQVRVKRPDALLVFITPGDRTTIEERLRNRGTEEESQIRRRLSEAERELMAWMEFDFLILNEDLARAVDDLAAIVRTRRLAVGG